jgi:hypothetical protein
MNTENMYNLHPLFNKPLREVLATVAEKSLYCRYLSDEHLKELTEIVLKGYPNCEDEYFGYINKIKPQYDFSSDEYAFTSKRN